MKKNPKNIAQSLVRSLEIKEVEKLNVLIGDLNTFYTSVQHTRLFKTLKGVLMKREEKTLILDKIFSSFPLGKESQALLALLVQRNQVADLAKIIAALREFRVKTFYVDEADVLTVRPLNKEQRERIEKVLQKISGCDLILKEKINPAILGGLVIRLHDSLIDVSLIRRIRELRKCLTA